MEKINLNAAFSDINSLLPKNLFVENFITNRKDEHQEFIFEVHVEINSGTFGELVHGAPENSMLQDNRANVERSINNYISTNLDKVLQIELEKYLQQKNSIYIPESNFVAELSNYCKETCNVCHSTGRTKCEPCIGVGYVSCSRCHGSGKIYTNTIKSKHQNVQSCNYCNDGRAQCTHCLSSGFVKCVDCAGETFNSWELHGYFKANVAYKTIFSKDNDKSEFTLAMKNMTIEKALSICTFEQLEYVIEGSKFIIRYKAMVPVSYLELNIHGKNKKITVLSSTGELCEAVAILDDVLQPYTTISTNYLAESNNKGTVTFYKEITKIPFIRTAINSLALSSDLYQIIDDLEMHSMGNMSKSNLHIIAKALKKSFSYQPKNIVKPLVLLVALPNLFIGAFLAFGFIPHSKTFAWGAFEAAITLSIITWGFSLIIMFILYKIRTNGLPKIFITPTSKILKIINSFCIDYSAIMAIIGLIVSSFQYDYVVKNFNLTDRYLVQKTTNTPSANSDTTPQQKTKKHKKSNH